MKTINHYQSDGGELLIQNQAHGTVLISGTPSRIGVVGCKDIRVVSTEDVIAVRGHGHASQKPLVITYNSAGISFGPMDLVGATDDSNKESWKRTVPNGFEAHTSCEGVHCDYISGLFLHYALQGRCPDFSVDAGEISHVSGDFVRATRDNFRINGITGKYALRVWDYKKLHPDHGQFWQEDKTKLHKGVPVLSNGKITNCTFWTPDTGHKWAKSSDGLMFTDGVYRNIHIEGNKIYTNNDNGLRADVMIDCEITPDNIFGRADEVKL